ncbi:hypothetical protein [Mycoplasmopsis arginini]|uniref:hypothetical protein n=1 Tax=Mycoplasmopsis arginini TaxID=2094 RepID=UPI00101BAFF5|nr:hypothetical protein [Mycoplasmopsis arginini]
MLFLVISDGVYTKVGTLTSKIDRYNEWKSVEGEKGYDDSCVTKLNIFIWWFIWEKTANWFH